MRFEEMETMHGNILPVDIDSGAHNRKRASELCNGAEFHFNNDLLQFVSFQVPINNSNCRMSRASHVATENVKVCMVTGN